MRLQLLSTLLIAFLVTEVSAENLYRGSDKKATPLPSDTRLLKDFGALDEGNFVHRPGYGLSTFNDPKLVTLGKFIFSTTTKAVNDAGFDVTVDGSAGHRSIAVKKGETIPQADLRKRLEAIVWAGPTPRKVNVVNNLESNEGTQILLTDGENYTNGPQGLGST